MQGIKRQLRQLKKETLAVYLACKDARVPWYAKILAAAVVAYAFSPIDLIPDFIPVIGYLDDLLIVPLGIWLVVKLIPPAVMTECREKAATMSGKKSSNWVAAGIVIVIWLLLAGLAIALISKVWNR